MKPKKHGFFLIEVLISTTILAIVFVTLIQSVNFVLVRTKRSRFDALASTVLQNSLEAAYSALVPLDWSTLTLDTPYHPAPNISAAQWELVAGPETVDAQFERSVTIKAVCRNATSGDRTDCPGVTDPNSKLVVATVSWQENGSTKEIQAELMLYKYF